MKCCKQLVLLVGKIPLLGTVLLPFVCVGLSLSHLTSSSRESGDEELSKDLSLRAQGSFDSFEPELQAKCVSEAVRWQNTWVRTMKYGCCHTENHRYEYVQNLIPTPGSSANKFNFRKHDWGKIETVHQLALHV